MNTKSTLADVQPGGRVRLATVPYDRARDLLGDAYNAGTHGIGYSQQIMELHDAVFAARQPVTTVPQGCDAGHSTGIRQNDEGRNICCPDCDLGRAYAGHAAPPAQAVDLGQFRETLARAVTWARRSDVTSHAGDADKIRKLLDLIDSQAVGK
ncbi:TPA: hypothetical protein QDZ75_004313 [Stenotrophomonas maltophilia]|nr:hypothetical protein [Stenotrophomonas maltophilia]